MYIISYVIPYRLFIFKIPKKNCAINFLLHIMKIVQEQWDFARI